MIQNVFITKFALTIGIVECEMDVDEKPTHWEKRCYGKFRGFNQGFYNEDFHLTMEEALNDCEKRRLRKLVSLEKQINKLKKLTFK